MVCTESQSWLHPLCILVAACPSLRCSCKKKAVSCTEAEGLVTELWFPRFVTMQWLCSQSCYLTAANQWTIVEIELLATVGWKCGCQPFSCPCLKNVTHWRKEICSTSLSKESTLAISSGISNHPIPTRSLSFLRAAACSNCSALCLHYACKRSHPFVEDSGFVSYAEKHIFGHGVVVSKICYRILECVFIPFAMSSRLSNCVGIELLATVGWKWGCQPLSWHTAERRFFWQVCLRNPLLPFFMELPIIQSLRQAWGSWEQRQAPTALHYGCIMPIPSLQLQEKACLMRRSRGFGHGVMASKMCYNAVIVLSVVLCDCCKPMNNCRDWAFSNSGWEVGLPAFQLPMFAKCDTLAKGDLLDMFVFRNPFLPFLLEIPIIQSLREAWASWERQHAPTALHCACTMLAKDPIPLSKIPDLCHMQKSIGLVTELWYPRFVTEYWNVFLSHLQCRVDYRTVSGLSF